MHLLRTQSLADINPLPPWHLFKYNLGTLAREWNKPLHVNIFHFLLSYSSRFPLVQSIIPALYLTTRKGHWFIPIITFLAFNCDFGNFLTLLNYFVLILSFIKWVFISLSWIIYLNIYSHFLQFISFFVHAAFLHPPYHKISLLLWAWFCICPFQISCQYFQYYPNCMYQWL